MSVRYLLGRILGLLLVMLMTATLVFVLVRLTGDPVTFMVTQDADPELMEHLRERLGLKDPLYVQYLRFLRDVATGNFGDSYKYLMPVMALIRKALIKTVILAFSAFSVSSLLALPVGVIAAVRRESLLDRALMASALVGMSIPTFWLGIMLILVFSVRLKILPTGGTGSIRNLVLPTITLAAWASARMARITRSSMLDVLGEDYLRTARAKGLLERVVIMRHALKNAAIAVVTLMGIELGSMMGGAIITETIFSWPGLGRLAVNAIYSRDYPLVQATVIYSAFFYASINTSVELLYGILDPRVSRVASG